MLSSRRVLLVLVLGVASSLALPASAIAQDVTVFFPHRLKGQGDVKNVTYRLAGDDTTTRYAGLPSRLLMPPGARICIVVDRANPILYQYAFSMKAKKVVVPDTMSSAVNALLALAKATGTPPLMAAATTEATPGGGVRGLRQEASRTLASRMEARRYDDHELYADKVAALYRQQLTLVTLKAASDTAQDFDALASQVARIFRDSVVHFSLTADEQFESIPKTPVTKMLRAHQLEARERSESIANAFNAASSSLREPMCKTPDPGRSSVVLAVGPETKGKEEPKRVTGDSVLSFEVETMSNDDFSFGAGVVFNVPFRRGKLFRVEEGKIVEDEGEDLLARPMFFGHFRRWGTRWLYGTLGTAMSGKELADAFIGATGRFGAESGVGITLGIGLALSRQVTGLARGRVGEPMPSDVDDITKITTKRLRPGFGVSLSLSGF